MNFVIESLPIVGRSYHLEGLDLRSKNDGYGASSVCQLLVMLDGEFSRAHAN